VFRQLVQDVVALYTVKDIRVVARPSVVDAGRVSLLQHLPETLRDYVFDKNAANIDVLIKKYYERCTEIARALGGVDIIDSATELVSSYPTPDSLPRFGVNPALRDRHVDLAPIVATKVELGPAIEGIGSENIVFDGILLDLSKYCLKTEGVYVDCYLSDTEGLDDYSRQLQSETVKGKERVNEAMAANISALKLAESLITSAATQDEKVAAFEKLMIPSLNAVNQRDRAE
jgi:hypothetical protein